VALRDLLRKLCRWLLLAVAGAAAVCVLLVLLLRWVDPPTSAFMLAARADALFNGERGYRSRYDWVDLEGISPQAAIAVIAAEDQQFPFHTGFDFQSIREAVRSNARGKRIRGASTISQQVAKNLFLWSGRSYVRKGLEAGFTLLIELLWPKERILEVYLNVAEFGRGVYGVEAAAQQFFKRPAKRLNRAQCALLAAVLPNPRRFRVAAPSPYVLGRRDWILKQMAGLGGASYLNQLEEPQEPPAR
jgi:monofunctional biosynthetic peptidoglycan transglycosylase